MIAFLVAAAMILLVGLRYNAHAKRTRRIRKRDNARHASEMAKRK
jgi:hypothetical protein